VKRPPSAYIREHIRVAIQPLDAPPRVEQLREVVEHLESEEMLMYASDYPHGHAFDPEADLLRHLPESLARKIRSENARAFYGLPMGAPGAPGEARAGSQAVAGPEGGGR
jgi:predicted TIM-barrel fold metal-dependent hydrolase